MNAPGRRAQGAYLPGIWITTIHVIIGAVAVGEAWAMTLFTETIDQSAFAKSAREWLPAMGQAKGVDAVRGVSIPGCAAV